MYSDPPYFLIIAGLFVSLTSGLAFEATLKEQVRAWSKKRSAQEIAQAKGFYLLFPFLGICAGICVFLAAGLDIFGLGMKFSYTLAIPMTVLIGWLIWSQLGKLLVMLQEGGSSAIDLDAL